MSPESTQFLHDLQRHVAITASEEGSEVGIDDAFTEYMFDVLTEAGEIDGGEVASYSSTGARASGFALSEDNSTLWLFLSDYRASTQVQSLVKGELEVHYRRLKRFLERASNGLHKKLEESAPSWDMAQQVDEVWKSIGEIRLIVLTNAELKTVVPLGGEVEGRTVHHAVWDLTRVRRLAESGRAQEPIYVDVDDVWGQPIPCLGPQGEPGCYESYLMMLPGEFLARIYETFGPRLLELNVRSFLQARGKINKGIQETIKSEPQRFLAYNNGLSMTASHVDVVPLPGGGIGVKQIDDLQIVNGGQTSASLHLAKVKSKADLSDIFVQAKLSVVKADQLEGLVPKISLYANSQNRVSMADFSANDPFHVELEKLSRTIWAPGKSGTNELTRWFYERARGQYADALGRERTPARQKKFKQIAPPAQRFTKTDVAKYENLWSQLPAVVSRGAEKNFRHFMLEQEKRGSQFVPNQDYFENLIAKAIIFRETDKQVLKMQLGGYKAQTVAYTISKISNATAQRIDLSAIWKAQRMPPELVAAVDDLAPLIHTTLLKSAGSRNVTEWAKQWACWQAIMDLAWTPPDGLITLSPRSSRSRSTASTSISEHLTDDEKKAVERVKSIDGTAWKALSSWAKETSNLQGWQRSLAFSLGRLLQAEREPSRKQAIQGAKILDEAERLGFSAQNHQ